MNIVSVNINQFLGKKIVPKSIETVEETEIYISNVIQYLQDNIKTTDDIVILHEVPYNSPNNPLYLEVFKNFVSKINKIDLVLEIPNYITFKNKRIFISCAIKMKGSPWKLEVPVNYECSSDGDSPNNILDNRAIELYNENNNIYLLGVHIPSGFNGSVMWDNIIYYYKKMSNKNLVIIGDMNAYADGTFRKRKFNELISLGAIDAWSSKGNKPTQGTYAAANGEEARIDYALLSLTAFLLLKDIKIDDNPRKGNSPFTDHSSVKLVY